MTVVDRGQQLRLQVDSIKTKCVTCMCINKNPWQIIGTQHPAESLVGASRIRHVKAEFHINRAAGIRSAHLNLPLRDYVFEMRV